MYIYIFFFFLSVNTTIRGRPLPFPSPCFVAEIKDRMDHRRKQLQLVQFLDPRSNTGILYANRFLGAAINIQQQPLRHVFPPEFEANRDIRAPLSLRICHFSGFLSADFVCFSFFYLIRFRLSSQQFSRNIDEREKRGGGEMETRSALQGRLVLSPQSPREHA